MCTFGQSVYLFLRQLLHAQHYLVYLPLKPKYATDLQAKVVTARMVIILVQNIRQQDEVLLVSEQIVTLEAEYHITVSRQLNEK